MHSEETGSSSPDVETADQSCEVSVRYSSDFTGEWCKERQKNNNNKKKLKPLPQPFLMQYWENGNGPVSPLMQARLLFMCMCGVLTNLGAGLPAYIE